MCDSTVSCLTSFPLFHQFIGYLVDFHLNLITYIHSDFEEGIPRTVALQHMRFLASYLNHYKSWRDGKNAPFLDEEGNLAVGDWTENEMLVGYPLGTEPQPITERQYISDHLAGVAAWSLATLKPGDCPYTRMQGVLSTALVDLRGTRLWSFSCLLHNHPAPWRRKTKERKNCFITCHSDSEEDNEGAAPATSTRNGRASLGGNHHTRRNKQCCFKACKNVATHQAQLFTQNYSEDYSCVHRYCDNCTELMFVFSPTYTPKTRAQTHLIRAGICHRCNRPGRWVNIANQKPFLPNQSEDQPIGWLAMYDFVEPKSERMIGFVGSSTIVDSMVWMSLVHRLERQHDENIALNYIRDGFNHDQSEFLGKDKELLKQFFNGTCTICTEDDFDPCDLYVPLSCACTVLVCKECFVSVAHTLAGDGKCPYCKDDTSWVSQLTRRVFPRQYLQENWRKRRENRWQDNYTDNIWRG
jgi:hypothetical protein